MPFTVNNEGYISVAYDPDCRRLDYEVQDSWSVILTARDSGGLTAMCRVRIAVLDVNEPPSLVPTSTSVSNQLPVSAFFGKPVPVIDSDSGQQHRFSVVGGDGSNYFDVEDLTGRLFVKTSLSNLNGGLQKRLRSSQRRR